MYIQPVAYLLQNKDREKLEALGGIQGLAKALSTSTSDGITLSPQGDLSLEHRQRAFGANAFKEVQQKAFLTLLLGNLKDPTLILLMAAALVISQYCWNLRVLCDRVLADIIIYQLCCLQLTYLLLLRFRQYLELQLRRSVSRMHGQKELQSGLQLLWSVGSVSAVTHPCGTSQHAVVCVLRYMQELGMTTRRICSSVS